jgi:hypothetical protein
MHVIGEMSATPRRLRGHPTPARPTEPVETTQMATS